MPITYLLLCIDMDPRENIIKAADTYHLKDNARLGPLGDYSLIFGQSVEIPGAPEFLWIAGTK